MAPISAIQFGVNSFLERSLAGPPNPGQRAGMAAAAGVVSALVSGPAELIMIQQQKSGSSLWQQFRRLTSQFGFISLTRGMVPTVVREGIYTATYLGVNPLLQETFMLRASLMHRPILAMFLAAAISGTAAALITQPFDTIKTRMQANMELLDYRKMKTTYEHIVEEGGVKTLYSGLLPRTQRIMCAVFILGEAKSLLTSFYFKYIRRI